MTTLTISPPLANLLAYCETECVAECCGLDAFDICPEQIAKWVQSVSRDSAHQAHRQIVDHIATLQLAGPDDVFVSGVLNAKWTRDACIAWFTDLMAKFDAPSHTRLP